MLLTFIVNHLYRVSVQFVQSNCPLFRTAVALLSVFMDRKPTRNGATATGFFPIVRRAGAVSPTDPDTPTDTDRQGQGRGQDTGRPATGGQGQPDRGTTRPKRPTTGGAGGLFGGCIGFPCIMQFVCEYSYKRLILGAFGSFWELLGCISMYNCL